MNNRKYDTSNRPRLSKEKIRKWIGLEQGKHCCKCCGKLLVITEAHYYKGISEYLRGHNPNSKKKEPKNTAEDFWSKVDKHRSGCWIWIGSKRKDGYAMFSWKGRRVLVHRLGYFLTFGIWPSKFACHVCDNPSCVNPNHLFDGDQIANMSDASRKGRLIRNMTAEKVREIVKLVESGRTRVEAAAIVGTSKATATQIMGGFTWNCITGFPRKRRPNYGK